MSDKAQVRSQGCSVGTEEAPYLIKGPLFCLKKLKRYTFCTKELPVEVLAMGSMDYISKK